jgi:integrase/recombinase XerD
MQLYLTAVRLFYDYLMHNEIREDNPVGRGRYTPGKATTLGVTSLRLRC